MSLTTRKRVLAAAATGVGLAIALSSCASAEQSGATTENTAGQEVASSSIDCKQFDQFGSKDELNGKKVEVYTTIVAPEDQPFIDTFKPFSECTGIEVNYNGSKQFEAQLPVRVQAGNAPDIAFFPQPGLLQRMVATGKVAAAPEAVAKNVDDNWTPAWKEYGTVDGTFYAAPLGANVKSFIWYSPKAFTDGGYQIPKSWDELIALSDKIAADHPDAKPWCAGIGSDAATGWPATDWLEDTVLRQDGPDVYDQWIKHEIPFNDQRIVKALDTVGTVLKNDKYVNGGFGDVKSIATTQFQDAGLPILKGQCFLHRQATFYQANWPAGTNVAEDGDVFAFPFPEMDPAIGQGIVGGGEFVGAFNDEPATQALQYWLSTSDWANLKAKASGPGWFNANKGLDLANLKSPIDKLAAEQLQDDSVTFRFDASDLMPAAVGSGAEWTQLTAWIAEDKSSQEVADAIEGAWPKS